MYLQKYDSHLGPLVAPLVNETSEPALQLHNSTDDRSVEFIVQQQLLSIAHEYLIREILDCSVYLHCNQQCGALIIYEGKVPSPTVLSQYRTAKRGITTVPWYVRIESSVPPRMNVRW